MKKFLLLFLLPVCASLSAQYSFVTAGSETPITCDEKPAYVKKDNEWGAQDDGGTVEYYYTFYADWCVWHRLRKNKKGEAYHLSLTSIQKVNMLKVDQAYVMFINNAYGVVLETSDIPYPCTNYTPDGKESDSTYIIPFIFSTEEGANQFIATIKKL